MTNQEDQHRAGEDRGLEVVNTDRGVPLGVGFVGASA
jgi:hypothetical protein